jgi:hypothetical protein
MEVNKIYPYLCKHGSCLKRAEFTFTDVEITETETKDGLIKEEPKTITLGHSCEDHVEEVRKLFEEIFTEGKKNNLNKNNPKSEENKV